MPDADLAIDTHVPPLSPETAPAAERAEALGFDGVWTPEMANDAFLPHPVVAEHTESVTMGTRIALSFTRSPMVLAYVAWELQRFSDGRFVLGLGTQVKGHNERRFSVDWESPGPRLREVVESLRHIWAVFQGDADRLDYEGDHYSFSLLTEAFDPGPIDHPDVPIHLAGVNEYNVRLAGELCEGFALHPFSTPAYAEEVVAPYLAEGAERSGRDPDEVTVTVSPLVISGETDEERVTRREEVRRRLAFYGSTRTYHDVLALHGWEDVGMELYELSREGRWAEMADLVTDEMLATFAIDAPPAELAAEARRVYGGVADRVALPLEHGEAYMGRVD